MVLGFAAGIADSNIGISKWLSMNTEDIKKLELM